MSESMKALIIEEQYMLREKIAGILSREDDVLMAIQVPSYAMLEIALKETEPDLIVADFFEFTKFLKKSEIQIDQFCPGARILLYTDESEWLRLNEAEHPGERKVINVRHIQQEVAVFLKEAMQKKKRDNSGKGLPKIILEKKTKTKVGKKHAEKTGKRG